mmetsp:Transcript_10723/g.38814  ORF Transcript_10723/g.38814 Transcript_10723/m.38814 type:complete len:212 (-) Transcript_10723:216-851(-)
MSACLRLPVAAYTGAATMIPSGTLCTPMAAAMTGPMDVNDENATANPSGRLCSVIVIAISSPRRIRRAFESFIPSSFPVNFDSKTSALGSKGSMRQYISDPVVVATVTQPNPFSIPFLMKSSTTLRVNITPHAIPSKNARSLLSGFCKIAMRPPTVVARPARRESNSAYSSSSSNIVMLKRMHGNTRTMLLRSGMSVGSSSNAFFATAEPR